VPLGQGGGHRDDEAGGWHGIALASPMMPVEGQELS
jgi:hypothetical protein